jgi:thiopurine S-methyltransferase
MEADFWIKAWNEGKTGFHRSEFHEKLVEYLPPLQPQKGQRVLVPLCGKSKDLLWLAGTGLEVQGVELHEPAVQAFFEENKLGSPQVARDPDFIRYSQGNITISCGNFFKFAAPQPFDFVYDRAALVALPAPMRQQYALAIQKLLKRGGRCLLIVYEYDQSRLEGPPFSVTAEEIYRLYADAFTLHRMEARRPPNDGPRLSAVEGLLQVVYVLEKN